MQVCDKKDTYYIPRGHNMITYTNTTPHAINVLNDENELIMEIPPSGMTIRLDQTEELVTRIPVGDAELDILKIKFTANEELPLPLPGHFFIVSQVVANAHPERPDFLMVSRTVRDDNGRIIGCRAWAIS